MSFFTPTTAMLLAAGLGTRMRPLTERTPKPLIEVGGKPLIDWTLDQLAAAGVGQAVVNVHHLAPQLIAHLEKRQAPTISISNESERLLDTGGGIVKALPLLGSDPFYVFGCDTITLDGTEPTLNRLNQAWAEDEMDVLMLVHPVDDTHGYQGAGDFFMDADGSLTRRGKAVRAPYVYTGIQIVHPRLFEGRKTEPFSMNLLWDEAIRDHRLKAIVHTGSWFHVGTPEAIETTNAALTRR